MAKAAIATLKQGDGTPPVADPAPIASPVVVTANAQAQKPQTPVSQQIQTEAATPVQAPARSRSDEIAAPRRAGDTRKRVDSAAADAISAGSRTAEPAVAFGRETATIQPKGDAVVEQTLTVARDGAWLDTLARDIANSAGNDGNLQFKLEPQNLGALTVAISQSEDGASIRMTADNDTTRNLLLDAQPKLIAEARAQGLKVSDTHVDLKQDQNQSQNQSANQDASRWAQGNAGQNGTAQNGQNRQSSPAHQPFVSNLGRKTGAESESLEGDSDALYA
jgi:flagellar hook-length control protein FliK